MLYTPTQQHDLRQFRSIGQEEFVIIHLALRVLPFSAFHWDLNHCVQYCTMPSQPCVLAFDASPIFHFLTWRIFYVLVYPLFSRSSYSRGYFVLYICVHVHKNIWQYTCSVRCALSVPVIQWVLDSRFVRQMSYFGLSDITPVINKDLLSFCTWVASLWLLCKKFFWDRHHHFMPSAYWSQGVKSDGHRAAFKRAKTKVSAVTEHVWIHELYVFHCFAQENNAVCLSPASYQNIHEWTGKLGVLLET